MKVRKKIKKNARLLFIIPLWITLFMVLFGCDLSGYKDSKTLLTIKNSTSFELDLISWSGFYFGDDAVWDVVLGEFAPGILPGNSSTRIVTPGSSYIYLWFAAGGPRYRTANIITVGKNDKATFTFYDSTIVIEASYIGGGLSGAALTIDVFEIVPLEATGDQERYAEFERLDE